MSGIYTVPFENVAVTAAQDLLAVVAHSTKQCVLLAYGLSQSTELGDAAEESVRVVIKSGQTTVGSGGSSVTPTPLDPVGAGASGFTARRNDTTAAVDGTIVNHYPHNWNIRGPLDCILPEQMQIIFGAGRRLTMTLEGAPADSVTMSGYLVIQEIG